MAEDLCSYKSSVAQETSVINFTGIFPPELNLKVDVNLNMYLNKKVVTPLNKCTMPPPRCNKDQLRCHRQKYHNVGLDY